MIDLYKLHVFAIAAHEGSFSAAAEHLYITQSAVSQHIKDLEASLGQQLFQRGWRGVSLTSEGEILARYAREIFDLVARAESELTNVQQLTAGKVSIGATPGAGIYLIPEWVQQFRARYPRLTVALQTGITSQIVTDVLAHRLDIGIIEGELDDMPRTQLGHLVLDTVEQMVVVGFKHPFWEAKKINLTDLHGQPFIVRQQGSQSRIWLEKMLKQHGIEPMIGAEFDNLESIKRAVAFGSCLAVLPFYVVRDEVAQNLLRPIPVEGRPLVRDLKLIWNRQTRLSPVTRAFLQALSALYPAFTPIDL